MDSGKAKEYSLVHVTTSGEYKAPLVASQLFDQAENQAIKKSGFAPARVEAWVIGSLREYFDKASKDKISELRTRCPHIKVHAIHGVSRLKRFPIMPLLQLYRRRLGNAPVIYHCRGERASEWAAELKKLFPGDKVVLDIRGYWPAELLYTRGINEPGLATGNDKADFDKSLRYLTETVSAADAVTTVSENLKQLLIKVAGARPDTSVVPCCISTVTDDSKRAGIRKQWGLSDSDIAIVYSGTTAAYQHLADLTFPFVKKLLEYNNNIKLVLLSPEPEKISLMCSEAGIAAGKTIVRNLPQAEVGDALTACDAGILIRMPTLVNKVANPVKIAEYLGAGLPIIMQKGIGGVPQQLYDISVLQGINIAPANADMDLYAREVNEWLKSDIASRRQTARRLASETYLWSSAIDISRNMYKKLLAGG